MRTGWGHAPKWGGLEATSDMDEKVIHEMNGGGVAFGGAWVPDCSGGRGVCIFVYIFPADGEVVHLKLFHEGF